MLLLQVAMNEPVVGKTSREKRKTAAIINAPNQLWYSKWRTLAVYCLTSFWREGKYQYSLQSFYTLVEISVKMADSAKVVKVGSRKSQVCDLSRN